MKYFSRSVFGFVIGALVALVAAGLGGTSAISRALAADGEAGATFRLLSADLAPGGKLPEAQVLDSFGRHGGNRSPHLRWENAPAGTRSLVVTLFDPAAPTGSGWWHWVVVDIPATARELASGASRHPAALPPGCREMRTDFGAPGYGGAAPPAGEIHPYVFTVHALDVERLDVPSDASAALVGFFVHQHSLGSATLIVNYGP